MDPVRVGYAQVMSQQEPDQRVEPDDEDLDAEEIAEGAADLFGADYKGEPASDADVPPPPG